MQFKREWVIPTIVGIVSFGGGALAGYLFSERRYKGYLKATVEDFDEIRSEQLQLDFKRAEMDKEFNHMIQEAAHVVRKFKDDGKEFLNRVTSEQGEQMTPYEERYAGWDWKEELANRTKEKPYVIHSDEFGEREFENDVDPKYDHTTLSYYAGDDILADDDNSPIYDVEELVGELKFGHGSMDPNVVFVRNERLHLEFEVLREPGCYQTDVLGIPEEDIRPPKIRSGLIMNEPFENYYFNWLVTKVMNIRELSPTSPQLKLLRILHSIEFVWLVSGDDNRAEDGTDLREQFLDQSGLIDDVGWRELGCSLLEMFIAFARTAETQTEDPVEAWFWEFMDNLRLKEWNDVSEVTPEHVIPVLETFIWRTYDYNGYGGIFPLDNPLEDQREVQLWYQLSNYLADKNRLP